MELEKVIHEKALKSLLYVGSVGEIQRFLEHTPGLNPEALIQAMDQLENKLIEGGRNHERELLTYVRKVVNDHLMTASRAQYPGASVSNADQLVRAALAAPNALRAYHLLRTYRHLLTPEVYADLEWKITSDQRAGSEYPPQEAVQGIKVLCVMSLLIDDQTIAVKGQLFWASQCRTMKEFRNGLRRLDRAEKMAEGSNDIVVRVGPLGARAGIYDEMGDVARAGDTYLKVLKLVESSEHDMLAHPIQIKLAGCYRAMGRYSDALALIDAALETSEKYKLTEQGFWTTEVRCRNIRGLLLEDLERYEEGGVEYKKAAQLAERFGDRGRQFTALTNLAASYGKRGDERASIDQFRQVLNTVESWANPVMVSSCHNNLGQMLLMMGRAAEARDEFGKALSIKISAGLKRGEFISFLGMGDALFELGEKESAKMFYTMSLIPVLETGELDLVVMYASRVASGNIESGEEGAGMAEWGLQIARAQGQLGYELMLVSYLFDYKLSKGDDEAALSLIQEAIERGQGHDACSPQLMRLQIKMARQLARLPETCQEAYQLLTAALANVERQMSDLLLDERRAEIISEWIDLYGALIDLLVEHGQSLSLPRDVTPNELAFNLHEAAKSRSFVAGLADAFITQPDSVPPQLQQRETRLLELEREFQASTARDQMISEEYRLKRLREVNVELSACWEEMKPYAPEYVRLRTGNPATLPDCVSLLSRRAGAVTAFVSLFCDKDRTTCFVIRSDTEDVQVFQSEISRQQLLDAARRLRRSFNGAPSEFPPYPPIRRERPRDRKLDFLEELSAPLLKFLPALEGVELICFAPHGPLHLLPLHALRAPNGQFLIEQFAVTYCPSLSSLSYCLQRGDRFLQNGAPKKVYCAGVASRNDTHTEFFEQDEQIFERGKWGTVTVDSALTASKKRVLEQLTQHEVIHLTCHGYFDDHDPLNSGLLVSDGLERPPRNPRTVSLLKRKDFLITARNFLRTRMNASLVALRACSTGLQAERNTGDEFEGLSRALLYAGNAALLVSLWNVDQMTSQTMLDRFYYYWTQSETPVEKWRALWMAQKDFLSNSEEPFLGHPYHWAPLTLIGDWN